MVDGYVWLSSDGQPGLGEHLLASLVSPIPVIGVAKTQCRADTWFIPIRRASAACSSRLQAWIRKKLLRASVTRMAITEFQQFWQLIVRRQEGRAARVCCIMLDAPNERSRFE
jgi:hypothetical protein